MSVWRAARPGDHVLILCDRFGGFSIGDVLIGGSLILAIGLWIWNLRTKPVSLEGKQGRDAKGESNNAATDVL